MMLKTREANDRKDEGLVTDEREHLEVHDKLVERVG